MAFTANPPQLALLKQAVEDYCRDCGILDCDERLRVAEVASQLLERGIVTLGELQRGLERAIGPCRRPT